MEFEYFLTLCQNKPLIRTKDFIVQDSSFLVQINRWVKDGKLIQLKRGVYVLNDLYQKVLTNRFYVANNLVWPSYVSLEKALEYWGLIPESVPRFTSITTKRPQEVNTKIGIFSYRHIQTTLMWGYQSVMQAGLVCFIATPEKALLDLFYFHPEQISEEYIQGLRLQNTEILNLDRLSQFAARFDKPKIKKASAKVILFIRSEDTKFKTL